MSDDVLESALHFDHESLEHDGRRKVHAVIDLKGLARGVDAQRPPLSIAFSVDISGSMRGEPLEHVMDSLVKLVSFLDDDDKVGLAVFSDDASAVSEVRPLTTDHRQALRGRIRRLSTLGRTNIEAGLLKAKEILPERTSRTVSPTSAAAVTTSCARSRSPSGRT
jgi:Mg-chelatase subunit ChlD